MIDSRPLNFGKLVLSTLCTQAKDFIHSMRMLVFDDILTQQYKHTFRYLKFDVIVIWRETA